MIVREAYRDRTHYCCRAHYSGHLPLPPDAPSLGAVEDARDHGGRCEWCQQGGPDDPENYTIGEF